VSWLLGFSDDKDTKKFVKQSDISIIKERSAPFAVFIVE
jgi:hypothetical protein